MTEEKKPVKVEFASSTVIEALEDYVQEALEGIAEVMECPGMARAFVSDESRLSDFTAFTFRREGNKPNPEEKVQDYTKKIADKLGITIDSPDIYIYEIGIKLRDK